jgi:hypothetical protein
MKRPLLILSLVFVFGCSNSSDPDTNGTGSIKHTIPKAGSSFELTTFNTNEKDTSFVFDVIATGLEIDGKKNVSRIGSTDQSFFFIAYDNNGDFATRGFIGEDSIWIPMPVASKKQITTPLVTNITLAQKDSKQSSGSVVLSESRI